MSSVHFQGKPFNITVIQVYAPTSNAEEAEVERFCEDLQDLLELKPKKRCPFNYRGLECKSRRSSDTKWSRAKANRDLPRERTGHSKHPLPTTQETTLHMDITITAYSEQRWICGLQRRRFRFRPGARLDHSELLCGRSFTRWKRTEKASDTDIRKGDRECLVHYSCQGLI